MQLKRGARQTLDHLYSDLDYLIESAHDPIAVEMLALRIRQRVEKEIEPRMERAAPSVEQTLADLIARIERLEHDAKGQERHAND